MIIAVGGGVIMVVGLRSIKGGVVGAAVMMSAPLADRGFRDGVSE